MIEQYDTFNAKGCPDETIFGDFCYQTIPSGYYDFLNDDDNDANNNPGSSVKNISTDTEGVEYATVVPNAPKADDNDK